MLPTTSGAPHRVRVDDLMALTQNGMVECVVLDTLHHWRAFDCSQRGSVKLDSDRVERNIVLTRYFCAGRVGAEPLFELVPSYSELSAVRFHRSALEVNFLALSWLGRGLFAQWFALELNDHAAFVEHRMLFEVVRRTVRPAF